MHLLAQGKANRLTIFNRILDPQFLNALLLYIVKSLNKHWLLPVRQNSMAKREKNTDFTLLIPLAARSKIPSHTSRENR